MKVELEKITVGHSPLTDSFFAGTTYSPGKWRNKKNVTNEVIDCVISRWCGFKEKLKASDGTVYEISVKKIK